MREDEERAQLGRALCGKLDPALIVPGEFKSLRNHLIATAIWSLATHHEPVDIVAVSRGLLHRGDLEAAGGFAYIVRLEDAARHGNQSEGKQSPTIESIYGKPLEQLTPPAGCEFTTEFRAPKIGEEYLTCTTGMAVQCIPGEKAAHLPRLILRRKLAANHLCQRAHCSAFQPVQWQGTSLTDPPPARQLLNETRYVRERLTAEQVERFGRFYSGQEQWEESTREHRKGRPTLTVNLLPALVARMVSDASAKGQPLSDEERDGLAVAITMLNMDAQRFYNYMLSAAAECCSVCTDPFRIRAVSDDPPGGGD